MTPNRSEPTRCRIKGCPVVGHFAAHDNRCPLHRGSEWDTPVRPTLAQQWEVDNEGGTP